VFPLSDTAEIQDLSAAQRDFILGFASTANRSLVFDAKQEGSHEDRDRVWRRWLHFCTTAGRGNNPFLTSLSDEQRTLHVKSFLSCYRVTKWSQSGELLGLRKSPVVAGTVREAASHLAASFRVHQHPSPLHITGSTNLHPSIRSLLTAYSNVDPPPKRQKAITPKLLRAMHNMSGARTTSLRDTPFAVITELATFAFFFAMRSCEFTTTEKPGRTKLATLDCIVFRNKQNQIISHRSPLLEYAYRVTVKFTLQKSKLKGEKRTHKASGNPVLCPVRSAASLIRRIYATVPGACGTTTINTMFLSGETFRLKAAYLLNQIRSTCTLGGGTEVFGFEANEIGTKSLRSGAAMALFLMDYSEDRIMILGRWSSNAFMVYIRPQVLEWTNNMSNDMIHHDSFFDATDAPRANQDADPRTGNRIFPINGGRLTFPRLHLGH
jgi:hypothetical protein